MKIRFNFPLKKTFAFALAIMLALPMTFINASANLQGVADDETFGSEKKLKMWYDAPAADSDWGWLNASFPMGNGYMGVNLFGGVAKERIQITENSTQDSNSTIGGLNNFAEVYIDFPHTDAGKSNYKRELVLDDGIARVSYDFDGVTYNREYFTSYPDKVMAVRLTSSGDSKVNFTLRPTIPYLCEYRETPGDNRGKRGTVVANGDTITLSGVMDYFNLQYEGQFKVMPVGGTMAANNVNGDKGTIEVKDADSVVILIAVGTNYIIGDSKVITSSNRLDKLKGNPHPHEKVSKYIADASAKTYDQLLAAHQEDYQGLYGRVNLNLGGSVPAIPLNKTIDNYRSGTFDPYLEELFFQFGRYLLICSSRKGGLPPNLQGMWNVHQDPPWRSGYWHNVNLQMNYWLAFPANLPELFESYVDYYRTYLPAGQTAAINNIKNNNPSQLDPVNAENGWALGNSTWPYSYSGSASHSGWGTGAWTTMMFWDYYDYTRDEKLLADTVYPAILGQAKFLSRIVQPINGKLLTKPSYSPENQHDGVSYKTVGATFDQQTIYENLVNTLKAAEILGVSDDPSLKRLADQKDLLDPIVIGKSGQIKEYREEEFYGDIGEYTHRHISQLLGAYPGQLINTSTPAWLDASRTTLKFRGDYPSTEKGWSKAERIANYARALDGEMAYGYYRNLIQKCALHNLFNAHDCNVTSTYNPTSKNIKFQVDANFGATSGVCEMLLQSNEYFIAPLAAMPKTWANGSYSGLLARGNFEVSASWANNQATSFEILSKSGGLCQVKYDDIKDAVVKTAGGDVVGFSVDSRDLISFNTVKGETYVITNIPARTIIAPASGLAVTRKGGSDVALSWKASSDAVSYNVYVARESAPDYTFIGSANGITFDYHSESVMDGLQYTFRVTAVGANERESKGTTALMLLVDKKELKSLIVKAQDLTRDDFKTDELWNDLANALNIAKALDGDEFADKAAVDAAIVALKAAMSKVTVEDGSIPVVNVSVGRRNVYLTHVVQMQKAPGTAVTSWRVHTETGGAVSSNDAIIDQHDGVLFSNVEATFRVQAMNGSTVVSTAYITFKNMAEMPRLNLVDAAGKPLTKGTTFCRTDSGSYPHYRVFDGNTATFYDVTSSPAYVGWDFGEKVKINVLKFMPRTSNWQERLNGIRFQGSNTSTSAGFVDLWVNPITLTEGSRTTSYPGVKVINLPDPDGYRYYRWYDGNAAVNHCNVSDIALYLNVDKTDLCNAVIAGRDLCESNYTPESWEPFAKALELAIPVYENFYAPQSKIENVTGPLVKALNELVIIPGSPLDYINNNTLIMPKQLINATELLYPEVADGYTISIKPGSSTNGEVVLPDGTVIPPEVNTNLKIALRISKDGAYADTLPLDITIPKAEDIIEDIVLPVDSFVSGYAANIRADIIGGSSLKGKTVVLKITSKEGNVVLASEPVVAGSNMISIDLKLSAHQMDMPAGNYTITALILEAVDKVSTEFAIKDMDETIWKPEAVIGEYDGAAALEIRFAQGTELEFNGRVVIDGLAYYDVKVVGSSLLVLDAPVSKINKGISIVVSGVKLTQLFPSYSFKFNINL